MTSLDYEHLEVINRCDAETSSGLFVFKDRIVCVCVKSTLKSETNIEGKERKKRQSRKRVDIYKYIYKRKRKETTTHYGRSGEEMFTSLSEAAL